MESSPWRNCWKGLDVGTLNLPRSLSHLSLAYHCTSVGAKGDAAAATRLEIDYRHTEVVRVCKHLNLEVDAVQRALVEDVRAQPAAEVGDLVWMRHRRYLGAAKRCAERGHVHAEVVEAALPVDPRKLSATHAAHVASFGLEARRGPLEEAFALQLQPVEDACSQCSPWPDPCPIQLSQQPAGCIRTAEGRRVQEQRKDEVRTFGELGQGRAAGPLGGDGGGLPDPGLPADCPSVKGASSCLKGTGSLEGPMVRLHHAHAIGQGQSA
mmetsp:Transcript_156699/g.380613  ORF Transcript_156699/g.380613 Transcript_156699/m.380613 type:complete len:267 (-) Transcript_156699:2-802(-)